MSTHDNSCPWIYGGACDCGLASDAAERDSLRRDLAVKSAALAEARAHVPGLRTLENAVRERNSLRRQISVARAALAQCATVIKDAAVFLRSSRRHLEGTAVEGTPWFDGLVHLMGVLFSFDQHKDISYAVRVEAAREAVERASAGLLDYVKFEPSEFGGSYSVRNLTEQLRALHDALDALTSERRR